MVDERRSFEVTRSNLYSRIQACRGAAGDQGLTATGAGLPCARICRGLAIALAVGKCRPRGRNHWTASRNKPVDNGAHGRRVEMGLYKLSLENKALTKGSKCFRLAVAYDGLSLPRTHHPGCLRRATAPFEPLLSGDDRCDKPDKHQFKVVITPSSSHAFRDSTEQFLLATSTYCPTTSSLSVAT
jgi:hypothetical protein